MADDQQPSARPEADALGAAPTLPAGGGRESSGPRRPRRERTSPRRWGLIPIVILVVLALAAAPTLLSSVRKTPRNRVGISYGGGPNEGVHFQRIIQPGSGLFVNGLFDSLYLYPSDQQNYIVSKTASQGSTNGSDSITAPTSDRVQVQYQVAAFFKLNIDRLRAFHEQLGLRYQAYTSKGWNNMLQDTLRQQMESAIQQETRRYTVDELFGSAKVLTDIQTAVRKTIALQLVESLGQEYFCGPDYFPGGKCNPITFFIKRIDIPMSVSSAYEAVQANKKQAEAINAVSQAIKDAGPDYAKVLAIQSGKVTFWIIPDGQDVVVPAPGSTSTSGSAPSSTSPSTAPSSGSGTTSSSTPTTTKR
jgi:regulator of protease activity HflC (stomatin/prohibitin superfamily)